MKKDEIITKIREVAHALNGKSPSMGDMKKFADISEKDWKGKYWVRWGDALTEAGYERNSFSLPTLGKEYVIKQMLNYFRSINRIPILREMTIYKRNNKSFPSVAAINHNFENKGYLEIKQELLSYCINNKEYSDLIPLFENDGVKIPSKGIDPQESSSSNFGYVYLIQHGNRPEYKIGMTNNILRREGEISIELPEKIEPIWKIQTDDPSGLEKYWHNRFKDKRKNGEWFNLSKNDVASFKRWKKIF